MAGNEFARGIGWDWQYKKIRISHYPSISDNQ
jgi:hypothetical protein